MKLILLTVGKLRDEWAREACDEYEKRVRRHLPIEIVEVKDSAALAKQWPARGRVVALDEHGREPTSNELAAKLGLWMGSSLPSVTLVIGAADGIPAELLARADEKLSLTRLTLPHRLARVLLLEQLYRALSILRNEPYHRA